MWIPSQVSLLPEGFNTHEGYDSAVIAELDVAAQRLTLTDGLVQIPMMELNILSPGFLVHQGTHLLRFPFLWLNQVITNALLWRYHKAILRELQSGVVAADDVID